MGDQFIGYDHLAHFRISVGDKNVELKGTLRGIWFPSVYYQQHKPVFIKGKSGGVYTSALLFRQFITHIHQELDPLILHGPIQYHTQPMGLIHMPAGEDSRRFPEGANQSGIALQIHDTDFALAGQTQILSGNIHDHGEPFPVPTVPEHQKTGVLSKKMLSYSTVGICQAGC